MSRSELAQSIDESTLGKVTHRQGDFNRKLGSEAAFQMEIKTLVTLAYSQRRRSRSLPQEVSWQPGCRSCLNPVTWIDSDPTGCAGQVEEACENQRRVPSLKVIKDQGNNDWAQCAPDLTGCVHAPSHHTGVFACDIHTNAPAGTQKEGRTGASDANQQSRK